MTYSANWTRFSDLDGSHENLRQEKLGFKV